MTPLPVELSSRGQWTLWALAAVGVLTAVVGAFVDPLQMWANWLLVSYFALTLALGGLCFVAIHYASGATWGVAFRRIPEAMAGLIPFTAVALGVVLIVRPQLYPWTGAGLGAGDAESALAFKRAWLDWPFFLARAGVYAGVWALFAWAIRRQSRLQDAGTDAWRTFRNRRLSVAFLVVFAVTFSLAAFDWIMSLEPAWYSTIFGVYNFAGLLVSVLAAIILVTIWLERTGPLAGVINDNHFHDLGKLLFAFCSFWAYIWFSQYMLIWYTNIPEETTYYIARTRGGWSVLFVLNIVLNWGVPFFVLISRNAKRHRRIIGAVAAVVLLGRWLDLYLMIMPPVLGERLQIGLLEIGLFAGGVGLFGLALTRALGEAPIVPVGDPHLVASLHYDQ
jgi:hypothetical protein